jgi:hypothetical protein
LYVGSAGYIAGNEILTTATIVASLGTSETLVWSGTGTVKTLTGYRANNSVQTIRSAAFTNNLLTLTLASFSPTLAASGLPSASLNWDQAASGFSVTVTNPADFLTSYISSVLSVTASVGSIGSLSGFTAGAKSNTPAGGVSWDQTFTVSTSTIYPVSNTITGGSVSATVNFNYYNGTTSSQYTLSTASFALTWATPTMSVTLGSLSGQLFLGAYTSVAYTVTVTGMSLASNYANSVSAVGGTVSSSSGSGTLTFTSPLHKDNGAASRTVSNTATFTRPAGVTGSQYTAQLTSASASASGTFTYPSFWIFTASTSAPPSRSDIITGSSFTGSVTQLGNQTKTLAGSINNPSASPQALWFAIRTAASQPTTFQTGASASLLSAVVATTGNTINLQPDSPPSGYVAESYTLYGITLQPGSTYVSIG